MGNREFLVPIGSVQRIFARKEPVRAGSFRK